MTCRCIDCKYHISHSKMVGNTLYITDFCARSLKKILWLALYSDRTCDNFEVKP